MKTGSIDPTIEREPVVRGKKHSLISGGSGGNGPSGGGGGGDKDDYQNRNDFADESEEQPGGIPDKSKVVTWFLLLVVMMTFGGLIGAYIVISTNNVLEWRPFELPLAVYVSTAIIFISSYTYHRGKQALFAGKQESARKWFVWTTVWGGIFISSQLVVWLSLVRAGAYIAGNPYTGFFYTLTAVHAAHVLGGIVALGVVLLRGWYPTANEDELQYRRDLTRSIGWYWHFMGLLWVVLFVLLGFWK